MPAPADACALTFGPSTHDTIAVALGGPVDPAHAPVPRSPAERLLFRHLYQTLIRVDCRAEVTPGLAESWAVHEDARIWTFTLRSDAAFWDGTPVTAESVRETWLTHEREGVAPWADSVSGSVSVTSEYELTVRLRRPYQDVPRVFADPTLAVARTVGTLGAWPLGTGTYQVTEHTPDEIQVVPLGAVSSDDLPLLRFIHVGDDPRDAIDLGADLLVSREPIVVDYIETLEDLEALPQPWDLVYVLADPLRTASDVGADEGSTLAQTLGSGTVRTESGPPEGPLWWDSFDACRLMGSFSVPPDPGDVAGRIVYRRSDPVGRALAERLVALAGSGGLPQVSDAPERLTAAGLADERFARSLADGQDLGFVLAIPKQVLDPCAMIAPLHRVMPWVAAADLHRVLVPLTETRSRIIVRRGVGTVLADWDGTPVLSVVVGH